MPILRVVELESRLLPKMTVTKPPLLGFICFILCALLLGFLTTKPHERVYTPFEPNQTHVHAYFDMSSSVSLKGSLDVYVQEASAFMAGLEDKGRVTYSTSHSKKIFDYDNNKSFLEKVKNLGFHNAGLKLGDSLRYHLEAIGDVNLLLIFSDRNQYSWSDLNWAYLEDEVDVRFVEYVGRDAIESHFFINQVKSSSSLGDNLSEWDVEIVRTGKPKEGKGSLEVSYKGKQLYFGSFYMPADKDKIDLRVRFISDLLGVISKKSEDGILFLLTPESDKYAKKDAFYTFVKGVKQNLLLVADPDGEQFLEDPAHHLNIALEILGFKVTRIDRFAKKPSLPQEDYPVKIVLAGIDRDIDSQCPRIDKENGHAEFGGGEQVKKKQVTWLIPFSARADYAVMCRCFARFSGIGNNPDFCTDVQTRDQYVSVMKSVGGKQVGGSVDVALNALAWHYKNASFHGEVLGFSIPLKPDMRLGFSYASLPALVRTLVNWQQLSFKEELGFSVWPRIQSISEGGYKDLLGRLISNVPSGENSLKSAPLSSLPKVWGADASYEVRAFGAKKDQDDPSYWLKLVLLGILFVCGFEAFVLCTRLVWQLAMKKKEAALIFAGVFLYDPAARGAVVLNTVGFSAPQMTTQRLSREVSSRTSIDLSPVVGSSLEFTPDLLKEPWLWAKSLSHITTKEGLLRGDIANWLKRGGFLLVQEAFDENALLAMTKGNTFRVGRESGWKTIPPDHELMRSFHLLDSLPTCNNQVWRGFHFDDRIAILAIPGGFLDRVLDKKGVYGCSEKENHERQVRVFVNILMVVLATDYKKDQIHLPEILKRLR